MIYILLSLLPFGFMSQQELANTGQPGLVHILNAMVGGWGGSLMAIGLVISLLGAWLSWTMLPVEATQQLSEQNYFLVGLVNLMTKVHLKIHFC